MVCFAIFFGQNGQIQNFENNNFFIVYILATNYTNFYGKKN